MHELACQLHKASSPPSTHLRGRRRSHMQPAWHSALQRDNSFNGKTDQVTVELD